VELLGWSVTLLQGSWQKTLTGGTGLPGFTILD
jgi:hypothetical protein